MYNKHRQDKQIDTDKHEDKSTNPKQPIGISYINIKPVTMQNTKQLSTNWLEPVERKKRSTHTYASLPVELRGLEYSV